MGIKSSHYQHEQMKRRVRWNEANLNEIEANKPARKKIDEPKTPYHPMIEEDGSPSTTSLNTAKTIDYAAHAEALKNALNKVALSTERYNSAFGVRTSSDEEDYAKQRLTASFEERRRAHYDEFKKVKEKACSFLSDENHDNGIHNFSSCSTLSTSARVVDIEDEDEDENDLSLPR